jgi:hypothetical protein
MRRSRSAHREATVVLNARSESWRAFQERLPLRSVAVEMEAHPVAALYVKKAARGTERNTDAE